MMEHELQILRSIRNVFAHATTLLTFETPEIARELKRSQIINVMMEVDIKHEDKVRLTEKLKPKQEFILLVKLMFLFLDSHHQNYGGALAVEVEWLAHILFASRIIERDQEHAPRRRYNFSSGLGRSDKSSCYSD